MKLFKCLVLFALLTASAVVHANELRISPVNLDIPAQSNSTVLRLKNLSDKEMLLQVRVEPWDSSAINLRDIVVSPAMLRVPPQAEQIVRIVNVGVPSQLEFERMYRIIIDDLAPPSALETEEQSSIGLKVRYALPLFIGGPNLITTRTNDTEKLKQAWKEYLQFSLIGERQIRFTNKAKLHARISKLTISHNGELLPLFSGLLGYVQPESTEIFNLPMDIPTGALLNAEINGVTITISQIGVDHD